MKSKLQHTSGPWKYTISKIHHRHQISNSQGGQICLMWNRGKDITEANAHLIAAAPEMLEALIAGARAARNHNVDVSAIDNIIEKATGLSIEEVLDIVSTRRANANP
jgi:hypothetical protein